MTRLNALIDQAADGSRPLSDVLRQVKIVASRIGDDELSMWVTKELNGYGIDDDLPSYRGSRPFLVLGDWSGPMGSGLKNASISGLGISEDFFERWFSAKFRESVAELEVFSKGDSEPIKRWDPWAVIEYNRRTRSGEGGARIEMMELLDARLVISRNVLVGMLDSIRTRVLDLALELERVSPGAGEPGGPTVEDAEVQAAVQTFHITINGDGANVSTGDHVRQRSTVKKGDPHELLRAARELGLSDDDAQAFRQAVEADGDVVSDHTRTFVERVRAGGVALIGNTTASLAATGLLQIAGQFLGA